MSSNRHRNMTGEQLHNPKGFDSASNNTTMVKDGSGSVLWTAQTDLPQALNIVSPQSAPPTENSGDVYIMDTTGTAYDINTITWQSGNTIRIAFNGAPDLSAVAADDYFVTSGNANSSNDGTFQISAVNDGSDYIDIINLNRSDATDDEATDAVGTGYYTLEEWDGVSKNMHVRFDGTSWISVTPSAGYTCYDITSGNILIFDGTDWTTTITTSASGGLNNVVEDTTPQLGGALDVQTFEITSTGSNNIGLHSNASAYVELGDNLGTNTFDIRDNASAVKAQFKSTGDLGVGTTASSGAWTSLAGSNNNRAHINFTGGTADKTTPVDGDLWYNTTAGTLNFYDGSTTTDLLAGGGGITHFEERAVTGKSITLDTTITTDAMIIGNNSTMGNKNCDNSIIAGFNATMGNVYASGSCFIGGGISASIEGSFNATLGGNNPTVDGVNYSAVIAGQNITANESEAVFMPQIRGKGKGTTSGTSVMKLFDSTASTVNFEVKDNGTVNMANLPTSSTGLSAGDLWNNSGVLNIV